MDKNEIKAEIARRLKNYRDKNALSQEDLARQVNSMIKEYLKIPSQISKSTVSQWERETFQPDPLLFAAIAAIAVIEKFPTEWEPKLGELARDIRSTQNGLTWQE